MVFGNDRSQILIYVVAFTVIAIGLYASSLHSYILFHSLVEITTIAIAFALFTLTWNARRFLTTGCLKVLGIGYGFIALIDLLHTLAYKGMGVFPTYGANLPTQLWIAGRSLQALLLCIAPLYARRNLNERVFLAISLVATAATVALVYSGTFPDCFIEGQGLTRFKIVSEYVISAILLSGLLLFIGKRGAFNPGVFTLIIAGILCTIGSELAFTSYVSVYAPANMIGHYLKLAAFALTYRALVVTGFKEPFELIFRDLKQAEAALTREKEFSRRLLESMADGVVACDADGLLTMFNRTAREWHGLDPLRLCPEEWAEHYDLFCLDGVTPLPTDEIPLARAFRGETVRDAGMAIRAKGQAPRFIVANGSVITDDKGDKIGAVVVMRDITDLRQAEEQLRAVNEELEDRVARRTAELRDSRDKLEEAQRIAHIAYWDRDFVANRIILADEAGRIFGISTRELVMDLEQWHRKWLILIHPDDRERTALAASDALSGLSTYNIEYRIVRPDGEVRQIHSEANVIRDETGRPIRMIGMMQDITTQKLVEDALRKLTRELEQKVKERTAELESKNAELERINRIFVGRELRMVELKKKIAELERDKTAHNVMVAEPDR